MFFLAASSGLAFMFYWGIGGIREQDVKKCAVCDRGYLRDERCSYCEE
jgi:hypothetical protein